MVGKEGNEARSLRDAGIGSPDGGVARRGGHGTASLGWMRWMPGLATMRQYRLAWLPHDLLAGLVLATMLVPVGIAYSVASGLPGIYGLYASIVPLIAYAAGRPPAGSWCRTGSSLAAVILGSSCRCRVEIRCARLRWPA